MKYGNKLVNKMKNRQWRVGWRHNGMPNEEPSWVDGIFESFYEADRFRKSLVDMGIFKMLNEHIFVDIIPSDTVKKLNNIIK
jgi:hypothetical protein